MRQNAENWLEVAGRVRHFRSDLLTDTQNQQLQAKTGELRLRLKEKADAGRIKLAIEALERVLKDTGGRIYPSSSLVENVEFFLVAAIVILGLRAYFIQPFKIPTNSMWPSYYGMTAEVFKPGEEPGFLRKAVRLIGLGATNYAVAAPADGEVLLGVFGDLRPAFSERAGRSLGVFPTMMRDYQFMVGGQVTKVSVPADFQGEFDQVLNEAFKGGAPNLYTALKTAAGNARQLERSTLIVRQGARPIEATVYWVPLGKKVRQGEKILSFDILTGDLLFVERFSYHFVQPKVGSGFVFRTGNIVGLAAEEGDKYFVKRLVGVPGDELEIKAPALYRNGQPIEGSEAFGKNARKEGKYPGYTNTGPMITTGGDLTTVVDGMMPVGGKVTVPENSFFALGDNSPRSKDSRYWGFVPEKSVVGRPLFIYYPFTRRWGPAR
jgi:signal peptidase I